MPPWLITMPPWYHVVWPFPRTSNNRMLLARISINLNVPDGFCSSFAHDTRTRRQVVSGSLAVGTTQPRAPRSSLHPQHQNQEHNSAAATQTSKRSDLVAVNPQYGARVDVGRLHVHEQPQQVVGGA